MSDQSQIIMTIDENKCCTIHIEGHKQDMLAMTAVLAGKMTEEFPKDIVILAILAAIEDPPKGNTNKCLINDAAIRGAVTRLKEKRGSDT